jgi:hypothetical protein
MLAYEIDVLWAPIEVLLVVEAVVLPSVAEKVVSVPQDDSSSDAWAAMTVSEAAVMMTTVEVAAAMMVKTKPFTSLSRWLLLESCGTTASFVSWKGMILRPSASRLGSHQIRCGDTEHGRTAPPGASGQMTMTMIWPLYS